jgi:hypothetical protein
MLSYRYVEGYKTKNYFVNIAGNALKDLMNMMLNMTDK